MTTPGPLSRAEIQRRVADAIANTDTSVSWQESPFHIDLQGTDPQMTVHLTFAVGVLDTAPHQLDRQRPSVGSVTRTGIVVRYTHHCRADSQVEDYRAALVAGERMIAAVLALDGDPSMSVRLETLRRPVLVGDGTFLTCDVEFSVLHRLPLV